MIIAIVDFMVAETDQARALEILAQDGSDATALDGNISFRSFTNAGDASHVGLMHEWDTPEAFETYLASDDFAAIGAKLRPLMTAAPTSRRYVADVYAP